MLPSALIICISVLFKEIGLLLIEISVKFYFVANYTFVFKLFYKVFGLDFIDGPEEAVEV